MVREFRNDNGITYQIIAENKELDRTLLCTWSDDGSPRYIGAWGINYQYKYWAQGHYFMDDLQAAVDYLNGKDKKPEHKDHDVSLNDFLATLFGGLQVAIFNTSTGDWLVGNPNFSVEVSSFEWDFSDELFVECVTIHYDPDEGESLWIDVAFDPRN